MLEGVIFDMDGVLIDSHPVHRQAWKKFLTTLGKRVPDEDLEYILEGRRRDEILRHFLGDLPSDALAEYGHRKDLFFEENFSHVKLLPGVADFLKNLERAGVRMAVATSASSSRTWRTLERHALHERFVAVITGDDVEAGKPDPAIYELAAQRMKISPPNLLVLEDAPCGVQAAKAAGIRCIGVTRNGRAEALLSAGASRIIPDFAGLSLAELEV